MVCIVRIRVYKVVVLYTILTAKLLFIQVIEISSKVLGEEHPDTLTSIANLVSTYRK
ncbi:hypothetical protein V8F06_014530 [Rhypophila decipiens]